VPLAVCATPIGNLEDITLRVLAELGAAVRFIQSRTTLRPAIGLVLGSGLGGFAATLSKATTIAYGEIPHFPTSTAIGHKGELVLGLSAAVPVAVMAGRVHYYEGYRPDQVVFPVRVLGRLGVKVLILTNAAGSVNVNYKPGELMVIEDHINLMGINPVLGPNEEQLGPRFFDMSEAYDPELRRIAERAAAGAGVAMKSGVYIAFSGRGLRSGPPGHRGEGLLEGGGHGAPRRVRGGERTLLRDTGRDQGLPGARRRRGRHVHGARSDRGAPHGAARARHLLHHEPGRGREQEEAGPPRGPRGGRESAGEPRRRARPDHRGGREAGVSRPPRRSQRRRPAITAPGPRALDELGRQARRARRRAHAPFSGFKVGAALRTRNGEVVTGCNIENATYGLTLCAERVAVFKAISEGLRGFEAIAVAADSARLAPPCGACRQILWEFCGDVRVHLLDLKGNARTFRLSELLPHPFDRRNL
jgi:homotetrameric cytidine deaminase